MGAPEAVARRTDRSHTARVLAGFLAERGAGSYSKKAPAAAVRVLER
jgi:hypothetical protein